MNANKKSIGLPNGWILCPSKTFPGKFYYFNVLNGEAAWSLTEVDKKILPKDNTIHKVANKSHNYPEPSTSPDDTSITSALNFGGNFKKPDIQPKNIPYTPLLPTFGQPTFPKYINNVDTVMPNIVWTPIQLPMPMFCPENRKPMIDEVTQTSEAEREFFIQTCSVPLCKRFVNYESPSLRFNDKNKPLNHLAPSLKTSTPLKNSVLESESQNMSPKSLIKEAVLKFETMSPDLKTPEMENVNKISNLRPPYDVATSTPKIVPEQGEIIDKLDRTDLRFLLLAKKRKSIDTIDAIGAGDNKKPKAIPENPTTPKKVTFDLSDMTDEDTVIIEEIQQNPNQMLFAPKSPSIPRLNDTSIKNDTHRHILNIPQLNKEIPQGTNTYRHILNIPQINQETVGIKNDTHLGATRNTSNEPSVLNIPPKMTVADTQKTMGVSKIQPIGNNGTKEKTVIANDTQIMTRPIVKDKVMSNTNDCWYIVVDTDVLLLDYDFIEQLVLSDRNCKLLIPYGVRVDIEGLCMGDCRGQQRVINARQITRKLAMPPRHYVVEPNPGYGDNVIVTTENIINCCLEASPDHYVVLITNDPYLQVKAKSLNIPNFKLNEVKHGAQIKPDTEINNITNDSTQIFSNNNKNSIDAIKKQLFVKETDKLILDCDRLINITRPKSMKMNENNIDSDISRDVENLNLMDNDDILKTQDNNNKNQFIFNENKNFINFEKRIQNPNAAFKVPNSKIETVNVSTSSPIVHYHNEVLKKTIKNTENIFCSVPTPNLKQSIFPNVPSYSKIDDESTKTLRHLPYNNNTEKVILTAPQARITKIINSIIPKNPQIQDETGIFKIPQPLLFKNRTTTAHVNSSNATDNRNSNLNKDSIDENLKRFSIKNKFMAQKIVNRIDEWTCTYTQIMEDVLNDLLQRNIENMKDTVTPLTLHDTLNCVKMLYDNHTKIREIMDNLSECINKFNCKKGKPKIPVNPDDFMKMFGYSVLLVQALENIQPNSEELSNAKSCLKYLLSNIESKSVETDPELLRRPVVGPVVERNDEEFRFNFLKDRSYIIEYLKKHFKDWAEYKDGLEDQHQNATFNGYQVQNHTEYKVVRTFGKDLNMFKIDSNKNISLTTNTQQPQKSNNGPKLIKLIENHPISKTVENNTESIGAKEALKTMKIVRNDHNVFLNYNNKNIEETAVKDFQALDEPEMMKTNPTNSIQEKDFITHGNTFMQIPEKDGPKMIRNIKIIEEYEKKIERKEPLDLDLLDYSEISVYGDIGTAERDEINDNINDSEEILDKHTNNDIKTLDMTDDTHLEGNDNFHANSFINATNNEKTFIIENNIPDTNFTNTENQTSNKNLETQTKLDSNKADSQNETQTNNDILTTDNNHHHHNNKVNNDNCVINYDRTVVNNDYDKTAVIRDDTTNDSGFENDSTYAHRLVKIFLNELSSSFRVIYGFVKKFIVEIREKEISEVRLNILHNQASKSLEDMVAIKQRLRSIIIRESAEETILKTLLLNAGVEATNDKRMTRYRQIVMKSLEQAQILENALKIIVSTTIGDFDAISTNSRSVRYFNIFE